MARFRRISNFHRIQYSVFPFCHFSFSFHFLCPCFLGFHTSHRTRRTSLRRRQKRKAKTAKRSCEVLLPWLQVHLLCLTVADWKYLIWQIIQCCKTIYIIREDCIMLYDRLTTCLPFYSGSAEFLLWGRPRSYQLPLSCREQVWWARADNDVVFLKARSAASRQQSQSRHDFPQTLWSFLTLVAVPQRASPRKLH